MRSVECGVCTAPGSVYRRPSLYCPPLAGPPTPRSGGWCKAIALFKDLFPHFKRFPKYIAPGWMVPADLLVVHEQLDDPAAHAVIDHRLDLVVGPVARGTGFRGQVAGCRLQVAGCRLQVAGGRLQVAGGRWQVTGDRWQVGHLR